MAKPGNAYQDAVAEVVRALDPRARIEVGAWTEGPDGRRDLDVALWPSAPGAPRLVLIECKDWQRPVGIAAVDALESKRRDLDAAVAIICSNSGFTGGALRKAARVGIPALSALIEGDGRVRVQVEEEIYTRKITVTRCESTWHFKVPDVNSIAPGTSPREIIHDGRLVAAWIRDKCLVLLGMSARSSDVIVKYKFRTPLQFHIRDVGLPVIGGDLKMSYTVQWCSQLVYVDASAGMYDYLRRRVILGEGIRQYHIKQVDFDRWSPIDFVPEHLLEGDLLEPGEARVSMALVMGLDTVEDAPAPDLDSLIESEEVQRT